ncbi:CgeB family protein [Neobacillus sp. SM06]|uniref:CgeB family protein n=1 Tax=Neobacillus sp. SM06 TaxID=3422492 RepID=UPI003D2B9EF8
MNILFLEDHPMWIHGLPNGFKDLGHHVKIFGFPQERMLTDFHPDLIVTMGWTKRTNSPHKQAEIKKFVRQAKVPHIFWSTEDPTHSKTFSIPYIQNTEPNFIFTICPDSVADFKQLGYPAAHMDFGYHPNVHFPVKTSQHFSIALVANAYPDILQKYPNHYRHQAIDILIRPLIEKNKRIDFWGRDWEKMSIYFTKELPQSWLHGYLDYQKANTVYSGADIVLGLQNHLTQLTQRTYEILGSGEFLLTIDTPEINRLFKPGVDLVTTKNKHETIELVTYYLTHPDERKQIQLNGLKAVQKHSYTNRARYILETLQSHSIL